MKNTYTKVSALESAIELATVNGNVELAEKLSAILKAENDRTERSKERSAEKRAENQATLLTLALNVLDVMEQGKQYTASTLFKAVGDNFAEIVNVSKMVTILNRLVTDGYVTRDNSLSKAYIYTKI